MVHFEILKHSFFIFGVAFENNELIMKSNFEAVKSINYIILITLF
jgi:hypothetical protein